MGLVNTDFRMAFQMLSRDAMFSATSSRVPRLLGTLLSIYREDAQVIHSNRLLDAPLS